jgi:hypothetical protein
MNIRMISSVGKSTIALKLIEFLKKEKDENSDHLDTDICHPDVEYVAFDHIQIDKGIILSLIFFLFQPYIILYIQVASFFVFQPYTKYICTYINMYICIYNYL